MHSLSRILELSAKLAVAVTLVTPTAALSQTLSGQDIANTHVGKCVNYWGESEGTECFKKNGVATYNDKTWGKDKGRWQIHGDKMCVKYSKAEGTECSSYKKVGDNTFTDGSYTWKIKK